MALLGFMSPEEKDALMNEVEAQTVPDDVETAEDMLFTVPDPEMDAIDAEPVDPSVKALFDETAIDIIVADIEQKVSAGLGQADLACRASSSIGLLVRVARSRFVGELPETASVASDT